MSQFLYKSAKVEVRDSSIAGMGIFAKEDISKDELIAVKRITRKTWFHDHAGDYIESPLQTP